MRRLLTGAASVVLALSPALFTAEAFAAPDNPTATISHVEPGDDGALSILVNVPEGADVDLGKVSLDVDGKAVDASAEIAGSVAEHQVRRTTVLAIDTSESMAGARFAAARAAATQFLSAVPEDVNVGIVTFDAHVRTALAPTTDRDAAKAVIDKLTLARGTALYDGVLAAITGSGTEGQRSVLVLSDGGNTNKTPLTSVTAVLSKGDVRLDAVALEQSGSDLGPLQQMASAGKGTVIPADAEALSQAFSDEAASLARQILVTATLPDTVTATEARVSVTLPTGSQSLVAATYSEIRSKKVSLSSPKVTDTGTALDLPPGVMYGGLAAIGLGLLVLLAGVFSAATADRTPRTVEQRIAAFGTASASGRGRVDSSFNLAEVKDATASILHRNRGFEARVEQRLLAAGSALKPAEWVLLHALISLLAGLTGLLLGNGSILFLVLGVLLGLALPWMWLGHRKKKRVAAFNSGLADTLQLISGSLSAGMSLAQALDAVVNEGTEPIAGEFKRVLIESRLGVPLEAALEGIAQRIASVDFAWVVMAIRIQREVGGNLAELLNTVAGTLRERDYLRRQVKTLSAEGRLSAYILIALPIGIAIYLLLTKRDYIAPLYTTGIGILLLAIACVLLSLGWLMMSRIVKVEV